jgi:hypothetical protein
MKSFLDPTGAYYSTKRDENSIFVIKNENYSNNSQIRSQMGNIWARIDDGKGKRNQTISIY